MAATSDATPASVTGRKIGNSLRVSALPRPQLYLLLRVAAASADPITALVLPEEAEQRVGLAEHCRRDNRHEHERRKLQSPVNHCFPFPPRIAAVARERTAVGGRSL